MGIDAHSSIDCSAATHSVAESRDGKAIRSVWLVSKRSYAAAEPPALPGSQLLSCFLCLMVSGTGLLCLGDVGCLALRFFVRRNMIRLSIDLRNDGTAGLQQISWPRRSYMNQSACNYIAKQIRQNPGKTGVCCLILSNSTQTIGWRSLGYMLRRYVTGSAFPATESAKVACTGKAPCKRSNLPLHRSLCSTTG